MKKTNLRKLFAFAVLSAGLIAATNAYSENAIGVEPVEAANCHFTGISSDYCNASDGNNNYRVLECKPGTTDCSYTPVGVLAR